MSRTKIRDKKVVFNVLNPVDHKRLEIANSMVNFSGWVKQQIDLLLGHPQTIEPLSVDVTPISDEEQRDQFL